MLRDILIIAALLCFSLLQDLLDIHPRSMAETEDLYERVSNLLKSGFFHVLLWQTDLPWPLFNSTGGPDWNQTLKI